MLSFWERESFFGQVDVAIIGSGIVGLNAAWYLKRQKPALRVLVLERGMLPSGASSRNAGFACYGTPGELLEYLEYHTEEEVFSLVERRWRGLRRLRENLGDAAIDFKNYGGYEVFDDKARYEACADRMSYLNSRLAGIVGQQENFRDVSGDIPKFGLKGVQHMLLSLTEGQIDTGKMITALIARAQQAGVMILNGIGIDKIEDDGRRVNVRSANGINFSCGKLIVATNGFARQLLPELEVVPARAQVLITRPISGLKLKGAFHFDNGYYYFRNIGDRVLLGGGRNLDIKGEETTEMITSQLIQERLDRMLREMILPYTAHEVVMRWAGIMGMGSKKGSIIKTVSPNVVAAVRQGGTGIAIGTLVGEEAAKLLVG